MAPAAKEITLVVPGQALPPGPVSTAAVGACKAAVRVGARRGGGETVRLAARVNDDIVLVRIANGPALYLHPEVACDLMRAQTGGGSLTERRRGETLPVDGDVAVLPQLSWRGLQAPVATRSGFRDWLGEAWIDAVEVVTGLLQDKAADMLTAAVTKTLDGQVDPGMYLLSPDPLPRLKGSGKKRSALPAAPDGDPILVFVHGAFLDTAGTFGKLWSLHPDRVRAVFQRYAGRVYALEHATLSASPLANALALARALPKGARLHLVTHSRGGLVAEVLARVCGGQGLRPEDLALFGANAYQSHRADLEALARLVRRNQIRVERVVRVACPARGTLLASRRLDAYLSVLKWGMDLAGVPVVPELIGFLAEVARRRTDPAEFPGLEAMMPGRPVVQWLNAPAEPVPGDLRVVAGDLEGDSILSWLKTLMSDAFHWTDNDLIVQTRSMYGGTPRAGGAASFWLDRGANITHFNYFANERSAAAVANGLLQEQPEEFLPIGPLSWAGEDAGGTRAAVARARGGPANERPAVFVLPGILGSHLKVDGKRVWLSLRFVSQLEALKWDPRKADRVRPDGPIGVCYDDLIEYLADSHEVIPFSFDWRRPIEDEAQRLADAVEMALAARHATQQPVRLLAHSMGGVVARAMRLERPETWKRMMARAGARVLMLGTPNGGSWAPMQVLSGDDTFGNLLTAAGSLFDGHGARQLIAEMPGLLQLQASLLDASWGLEHTEGWQRLADADLRSVRERLEEGTWWHSDPLQLEPYQWGVPPQGVLDRAVDLRRRLDAQREALGADASKMVLVVGEGQRTAAGIRVTDTGVEYLDVRRGGDGRVTHANARLPGVRSWQVDAGHSDLADAEDAFEGYLELLTRGETSKLSPLREVGGGVRGAGEEAVEPVQMAPRPTRSPRDSRPPVLPREVFAGRDLRPAPAVQTSGPRLRISVVNGNLKFVRPALMLGHYKSMILTGSEKAMDQLLDREMSESLGAGLYPADVGSHQVFVNTRRHPDNPFLPPRPEAVIVVGLGEEGELRAAQLSDTARQGALAYAQRMSETRAGGSTSFELAATVIGSGGSGMNVGAAAQAIATGVRRANERLAAVNWPVVTHLQLIELFLDRANEAHQALNALAGSYPEGFDLEPQIISGQGALLRPADSGYRGAGYDFISVQRRGDEDSAVIEFTLDTRRARSEVRGQATQGKLVDELVSVGADDRNRNQQIGRSLFQLLVPIELEPFLSGSGELLLQLDQATAAYPWELLDTPRDETNLRRDARPWAVRTRLLRKLRTPDFREQPLGARFEAGAIVIGEPLCDPAVYPPLPGAAEEARAVAAVLNTEARLQKNALAIVNAMLAQPYRIIHIAGHGDFLEDGTGGVVLSNGAMLSPREIKAMRIVPELAFINCCHLGRMADPAASRIPLTGRRPLFAANVAEQLIRIGVRCVVAAGWAVDDGPATDFAKHFYQALIRGRRFVEAVGRAREATWERHPHSNTWAAYQSYGDPDWRYERGGADAAPAASQPEPIASAAALEIELQTLAVQSKYGQIGPDQVRMRLEQLEGRYATCWGAQGEIAQAFGAAHAAIGSLDAAIGWYARAVAAENGGAALRAGEQLGKLRARRGEKLPNAAAGRREIGAAVKILQHLAALQPTSERESLLGSAFKRLAMLEQRRRRRAQARRAIEKMARHYRNAETLARQKEADHLHYPAMNRMSAELILNCGRKDWSGFEAAELAAVRQSLQKKVMQDPDFWAVAGLTELRTYEALGQRRLAQALDGILAELDDVYARVSSTSMWDSVLAQARFTLQPYMEASQSPEERDAVRRLLTRLKDFAMGSGEGARGRLSKTRRMEASIIRSRLKIRDDRFKEPERP